MIANVEKPLITHPEKTRSCLVDVNSIKIEPGTKNRG